MSASRIVPRTTALALTALASLGLAQTPASAQGTYKIGISGAATGPNSPSYLPHIEGIRLYIRQLNDAGGVNGSKVDVVFVDDKGAPSDAAANAKRLMDDESALTVALMSISSTYAPMFQAATRTKTPVMLLGQAVCPANAATPEMNPLVFCGGSTSDPNTAGYWQVPLVKKLAERNKETLKLGLVAMDIPISRQGVDNMEKLAKELGIEVVDKIAIPPGTADVSGAAARLKEKGATYVTSWAPVVTAVQVLGALRRQGWDGWYVHNHSAEAEDTLRKLKDPKLVISPEYSFSVEKAPAYAQIETAAKKYGVTTPVDMMPLGWAGGMILEAGLRKCGTGCTREKLAEVLNTISVETAGVYPSPVAWTKTDHTRTANFTAYVWDNASQAPKRITNFPVVKNGKLADVQFVN